MAKDNRPRNWGVVIYPDSSPENWRELLDSQHIAWAESPFHCFDVNEGTGEQKKPHYHVALSFEGKKSLEQIKAILDGITDVLPIPLNSLRGYVRYMAHMDNPEKYQYPVDQIIGHGGLDVDDLLRLSASARYRVVGKICAYAAEHNILYFSDLADFCLKEHPEDWYPVLVDSNTYYISNYIRELRHKIKDEIYKGA